jgi:hypothetical protein
MWVDSSVAPGAGMQSIPLTSPVPTRRDVLPGLPIHVLSNSGLANEKQRFLFQEGATQVIRAPTSNLVAVRVSNSQGSFEGEFPYQTPSSSDIAAAAYVQVGPVAAPLDAVMQQTTPCRRIATEQTASSTFTQPTVGTTYTQPSVGTTYTQPSVGTAYAQFSPTRQQSVPLHPPPLVRRVSMPSPARPSNVFRQSSADFLRPASIVASPSQVLAPRLLRPSSAPDLQVVKALERAVEIVQTSASQVTSALDRHTEALNRLQILQDAMDFVDMSDGSGAVTREVSPEKECLSRTPPSSVIVKANAVSSTSVNPLLPRSGEPSTVASVGHRPKHFMGDSDPAVPVAVAWPTPMRVDFERDLTPRKIG